MAYLNLASIRFCTESEGPGKRLAIWVQGCERRCPGCCNTHMQAFKQNIIVDTSDLIGLLEDEMKKNDIEGLSFIGGEPMLQSEGLCEIAKWAKEQGLTVLIFTGYLLDELKQLDNAHVNDLLSYTDLLVDGPYVQELYDSERDWIGSTNQCVHFLSTAYEEGIEYKNSEHKMEVLVSEKDILVNGWPY